MSRNADVEADNRTPTHADQDRYSPRSPAWSPAWSPPAQCLPRVLCQMKHPPPVFSRQKTTNNLENVKEEADAGLQKQKQIISKL